MELISLARKYLAIFCFPLVLIMCNAPTSSDTKSHTPADYKNADTLLIAEIDTLVEQINNGVMQQGFPDVLHFRILSENDSLEYWTVDNEPRRISLKMYPDSQFIWPTFFIMGDELLLTRYREWKGDSIPTAREVFTYYHDGEIFYARERSIELAPGQPPARLRLEEFHISEETPENLESKYIQFYKIVKDTLALHFNGNKE